MSADGNPKKLAIGGILLAVAFGTTGYAWLGGGSGGNSSIGRSDGPLTQVVRNVPVDKTEPRRVVADRRPVAHPPSRDVRVRGPRAEDNRLHPKQRGTWNRGVKEKGNKPAC